MLRPTRAPRLAALRSVNARPLPAALVAAVVLVLAACGDPTGPRPPDVVRPPHLTAVGTPDHLAAINADVRPGAQGSQIVGEAEVPNEARPGIGPDGRADMARAGSELGSGSDASSAVGRNGSELGSGTDG
jgi:hypothetical protein